MNPQDAHQIANPEIFRYINGCNTSSTKDGACFGKEKGNLCDDCKSTLKGILIAQEKEIEFIGQMIEFWEVDDSDLWLPVLGHMKKRLEALKISCQDLRRVLK